MAHGNWPFQRDVTPLYTEMELPETVPGESGLARTRLTRTLILLALGVTGGIVAPLVMLPNFRPQDQAAPDSPVAVSTKPFKSAAAVAYENDLVQLAGVKHKEEARRIIQQINLAFPREPSEMIAVGALDKKQDLQAHGINQPLLPLMQTIAAECRKYPQGTDFYGNALSTYCSWRRGKFSHQRALAEVSHSLKMRSDFMKAGGVIVTGEQRSWRAASPSAINHSTTAYLP